MINLELALSDLVQIEKRLERLSKGEGGGCGPGSADREVQIEKCISPPVLAPPHTHISC